MLGQSRFGEVSASAQSLIESSAATDPNFAAKLQQASTELAQQDRRLP